MRLLYLLFVFMMAGMVLLTGCTQQDSSLDETDDNGVETQPVELDAEKVNTHLTKISDYVDAYWMRSEWFYWNDVEPEQGEFDWDYADSFSHEEVLGLATLEKCE